MPKSPAPVHSLTKQFGLIAALITACCATPDGMAAIKKQDAKPTAAIIKKLPQKQNENTEFAHFAQWKEVADFIDMMAAKHGFDKTELASTFDQVHYVESAIQLMKPAPAGKPKNWKVYRSRFVDAYRINAGIAFWDKYADVLTRAENQYGVPAEIIVGLIGVETVFGRNTGNFRVMDALTTLAFAYPDTPTRTARMEFFRGELENMLLLARESNLDPFLFKGSYAGAIGWSQFMPSSIRKFAVDFDGDGQIDLLASPTDAIGSVAHYLAMHGWKKNVPTAFPATLMINPENEQELSKLTGILGQGLRASYHLDELRTVATTASPDAPDNLLYGLVDLQNGNEPTEYWLATENFFAITQYNRSYFYAMSVIDLGKVIAAARTK
ncbi:lytic murein transglycosylase B [Undibacterium sp. Jales W-56]|uniref:lytic murein transglycosylase B n=1 Tax=Undibacterium sp. Jales W-56 TaxID=2897325 RepID=UPI0021D23484|nr:lytic murein transglycosylase B [Undibacterium sp. Jales W-56]MCU6432687.1 lytic murein transglycosylase B [Undibacterium sp. Jales W-56]